MKGISFLGKLIFLTLLSTSVSADWAVKNVHIRTVEQIALGGSTVTRVIFETNADSVMPSFNCAPNTTAIPGTANRYQASYWGSTNAYHQIILAIALAAQAQDFPVDVFFEGSGCNVQTAYGYYGLGRRMMGVSVHQE